MNLRVVLVEPEHECNVGSIARLMKNFGLSKLWLVNPKMVLGKEAYTLAMHAGDVLTTASIVDALEDAVAGAQWVIGTTSIVAKKPGSLHRNAITLEVLAELTRTRRGELALLFGREGSGLSNQELDRCDLIVTISSSATYRALNVASAAAIVFYELWIAAGHPGARGYVDEADAETRERLRGLFDALAVQGGLPPHKRCLAAKAFHNVVSRACMSKREAFLILGVLRRALKT